MNMDTSDSSDEEKKVLYDFNKQSNFSMVKHVYWDILNNKTV